MSDATGRGPGSPAAASRTVPVLDVRGLSSYTQQSFGASVASKHVTKVGSSFASLLCFSLQPFEFGEAAGNL